MKTNKFFLTGYILISITAGWLLGSFTTRAFSQSKEIKQNESINLPSIYMNGEVLPTVILSEFSFTAE